MNLDRQKGGADSSEWCAESLRLTAFPNPPYEYDIEASWARTIGTPPEEVVKKPKTNFLQVHGSLADWVLVHEVRPLRIDWNMVGPKAAGEPIEVPWIGPMNNLLDQFSSLMRVWLNECPPIRRLAFGAVLHLPVEDKVLGYRKLSDYLPSVKFDAENSSDFHYQINRPRPSKSGISGLQINRLSKWSVGLWGRAAFSLRPNGVMAQGNTLAVYSCRLELDINSAENYTENLPGEYLQELFRELIDSGLELAQEGDLP